MKIFCICLFTSLYILSNVTYVQGQFEEQGPLYDENGFLEKAWVDFVYSCERSDKIVVQVWKATSPDYEGEEYHRLFYRDKLLLEEAVWKGVDGVTAQEDVCK